MVYLILKVTRERPPPSHPTHRLEMLRWCIICVRGYSRMECGMHTILGRVVVHTTHMYKETAAGACFYAKACSLSACASESAGCSSWASAPRWGWRSRGRRGSIADDELLLRNCILNFIQCPITISSWNRICWILLIGIIARSAITLYI